MITNWIDKEFSMVIVKVIALALGANAHLVAQEPAGRPDLIVRPVEPDKIGQVDFRQLTDQIETLSSSAQLYDQIVQRLNKEANGSPEDANKIALVKLQSLKPIAGAIVLTSGAIGSFQVTTLVQQARNRSQSSAIAQLASTVDEEIDELLTKVQSVGGKLSGDPGSLLLLAKKIERRDELLDDLKAIAETERSLNVTLNRLKELDRAAQTFADLAREECLRQTEAIRRNRIAKDSALLQQEAQRLSIAIQTLVPTVDSFKGRPANPVVPEVTPALPTELPLPKLSPEMEAKILTLVKRKSK